MYRSALNFWTCLSAYLEDSRTAGMTAELKIASSASAFVTFER